MTSERAPLSVPPAPPHRLMVVGGGPFQLDMIRTAKSLGCFVAVVDRDASAPGMALSDAPLAIDTTDVEAIVRAANELAIEGVVTAASDAAVGAVAAVGDARGLRALPVEAARRCRDKLATFEAMRAAGLPMPETHVAGSSLSQTILSNLGGYPLVIKPRSAAGGRGVSVVGAEEGLGAALARAARYAKDGEGVLAQRFVRGRAVGVEAFFAQGKLLTAFVMDDQFEPGFVSPIGHAMPTSLSVEEQARVTADVARIAEALALRDGPANFDLRIEDGVTVLLEVNARLGGNSITDLVRETYGVDLSAATIRAALGFDPSPELARRAATPTACRLIVAKDGGVVRSIGAPPSSPSAIAIDLTVEAGRAAALRVDEHAIVGRVLARGQSPADAVDRARELAMEIVNMISWERP